MVFRAVLFTIAQEWKQSKPPLTDKWISKMWYFLLPYNGILFGNEKE